MREPAMYRFVEKGVYTTTLTRETDAVFLVFISPLYIAAKKTGALSFDSKKKEKCQLHYCPMHLTGSHSVNWVV